MFARPPTGGMMRACRPTRSSMRSSAPASSTERRTSSSTASARRSPNGPYGDLLKGKWLGHPLHPLLTDIPIGFWTSGVMLDFLSPKQSRKAAHAPHRPRHDRARSRLRSPGSPTRRPSRIPRSDESLQRMPSATSRATLMFALSWRARHKDHHARGVMWSLLGSTVATGAGLLGGNLAFGRAKA